MMIDIVEETLVMEGEGTYEDESSNQYLTQQLQDIHLQLVNLNH